MKSHIKVITLIFQMQFHYVEITFLKLFHRTLFFISNLYVFIENRYFGFSLKYVSFTGVEHEREMIDFNDKVNVFPYLTKQPTDDRL